MRIESRPTLKVEIVLRLDEDEARALDALAGYDIEAFLAVFYEKLGRAYLEPHEAGLRRLFACLQSGSGVRAILNSLADCREVFHGAKRAVPLIPRRPENRLWLLTPPPEEGLSS